METGRGYLTRHHEVSTKIDWKHILKTENDRNCMLHNRHVYHSIKEQNQNCRQQSAFKIHFGREGPLNPHVLAQYSTTLESARHSHSRKRRVDRTSLNHSRSRLQCKSSNAWNSFRFTTLVQSCARSNTAQMHQFPNRTTEASSPQGSQSHPTTSYTRT